MEEIDGIEDQLRSVELKVLQQNSELCDDTIRLLSG